MVGLVTARALRLTIEYKLEIILKLRPHGQAVKTPPFHGGIPGSNPGGVTKCKPARLREGPCGAPRSEARELMYGK